MTRVFLLALLAPSACALQLLPAAVRAEHPPAAAARAAPLALGRRQALLAALAFPAAAHASGGATAGKTTSIPRAKTRYYGRITTAVGAFVRLEAGLQDKAKVKAFFNEKDDASPFAELTGAGFLLATAFKIDGKIPPDKVAQVKMHKAFLKDLNALKSAAGGDGAKKAYAQAAESLNVYLAGVELPPLGDASYLSDEAPVTPPIN